MKMPVILCVLLGGCATIEARLPEISAQDISKEQAFQEQVAFGEIALLRDRLMRVAYPVMKENADICKKTRLDIGAVTHTLKSYSKKLRQSAAREVGAQDRPTLIYVRKGSPADIAGLRAGDTLLSENDDPLSSPGKGVANVLEGATHIKIRRKGDIQDIAIRPERICGYDVKLKMTPTVNAYATGKSIIVTSGMMNFVKSDEELALIVGHELAHNELGHVKKIVTNVILSGFATRYTRPFESEADYVGMYYMARAGYDIENAEDIWRRFGQLSPRGIARAKTHPKYPSRYLSLAATRLEIEEKVMKGQPLLPNMREGT